MQSDEARPGVRPYDNAWLLLGLTALFWAGNALAGRLAVGEISPMALTLVRWIGAIALILPFVRDRLAREWPIVRPRFTFVVALGALGLGGFNTLLYLAAHSTSGINLLIIQAAIPILIMIGGAALLSARIGAFQIVGALLTFAGVAVTASGGDLAVLLGLRFGLGDLLMVGASTCYAGYALLLRRKPPVSGLTLFVHLAIGAAGMGVVGVIWEIASGAAFWPTAKGWLIALYVIVFPSICAQIFFIRGVELIGATRAGLSINLIPVFGSLLMVAAGEAFEASHAVAMALVLGGVALAERFRPPAPDPDPISRSSAP
jgi:drug/metabolite transporter (DMT)-like permease